MISLYINRKIKENTALVFTAMNVLFVILISVKELLNDFLLN